MTPAERLLAVRAVLDEDERVATDPVLTPHRRWSVVSAPRNSALTTPHSACVQDDQGLPVTRWMHASLARHIARNDPAAVVATVTAGRAMCDLYEWHTKGDHGSAVCTGLGCRVFVAWSDGLLAAAR